MIFKPPSDDAEPADPSSSADSTDGAAAAGALVQSAKKDPGTPSAS
jgi:hypothetical protein